MSDQSWDYTLGPDHPDYVEDIVEARRRWLGHDEFCPAQASDDAPCVCTRLAKARADERERIAQAIRDMRNRWLDKFDKGIVGTGPANVLAAFDRSARIARNWGQR